MARIKINQVVSAAFRVALVSFLEVPFRVRGLTHSIEKIGERDEALLRVNVRALARDLVGLVFFVVLEIISHQPVHRVRDVDAIGRKVERILKSLRGASFVSVLEKIITKIDITIRFEPAERTEFL